MTVDLSYDQPLIREIAARFDLRSPNREALEAVIRAIVGSSTENYPEVVADLATGVGKTYLMSSLVDYVATQGVRHVLVVTPGNVIQDKTVANFDEASSKYVPGADVVPFIITPNNFRTAAVGAALRDTDVLKVFVFNVQQLISPASKASRKTRTPDENLGDALYDYLLAADDLLVIADEHHLYHEKALSFSAAIRDLNPFALVGLTATPAASDESKVVFRYTLGRAIAEKHVKVPVIVYRRDGTRDEKTQLKDACTLLRQKEEAYEKYRSVTPGAASVKPVLFVVASNIGHCTEVGQVLAGQDFIGDPRAVLEITSESSEEALAALSAVEEADSPVRAIVSVNKLREGWDVKNIAVIVALRRLASQALTEQILGRGLRLPFGKRTDVPMVDQVDLVAHDSYRQLLAQKDILLQRIQATPSAADVDDQGAAVDAGAVADLGPNESTGQQPDPASTSTNVGGGNDTVANLEPVTFKIPNAEDEGGGALFFIETADRKNETTPKPQFRVDGAPQIIFPRRQANLTYATFTLSDIADGDAEAAGARFIAEVPTFLARDALELKETDGKLRVAVTPQANVEVQQALTGIDTIREDLASAILRQVEETRSERGAARRLVRAFLKGAGVTAATTTASWGELRRHHAIQGISDLIRTAHGQRKREITYSLVPITLPIEPVLVSDPRDANNAKFEKNAQFLGWARNIMPVASFDAGTTEWSLSQLLDRDPDVAWWLRLYTNGPAYIPTVEGNYFPDFIVLDKEDEFWVVEGKSDKNANDADVLRKRDAAEKWARSVRDSGDFGEWHYLFATESHIAKAGSWAGLKVLTAPE
ncbi:DEAD/DEAH box helicase [Nucisporomicrobium flavum]|uniref:DEAD/DEAH box helicase n=1 Tax=Nucisporomicrobium flavum TaxID=2785915 RepID=UPI0018F299BE|nr:DEAD/DEAH box helicase family protein [Nucisporomicrobium flavum]